MPEVTYPRVASPRFEFSGGRLCLDFANTLNHRGGEHPEEGLLAYADVLEWGREANLLDAALADQLQARAAARPADATAVLRRGVTLREAVFHIVAAARQGVHPADADLAILNAELALTLCHARVASHAGSFVWTWDAAASLDRVLWPIARSAADLLTGDELHAVRVCEGRSCDWLFMDTSKNQSRRWCDMRVCGNRAKVRRHYERRKGGAHAARPVAV